MDFFIQVGLAFVPLFVAIDPLGLVPIFVGLTSEFETRQVRRTLNVALAASLAIGVSFALGGQSIFRLMGIQMEDFQIGGGLLLFGLALTDILATGRRLGGDFKLFGIVPLATPLIAGPALLTTLVLARPQYGAAVTLTALTVNLVLTWAILAGSSWLVARVGKELLSGVSKVVMILLAGYGVMLVRHGVMACVEAARIN